MRRTSFRAGVPHSVGLREISILIRTRTGFNFPEITAYAALTETPGVGDARSRDDLDDHSVEWARANRRDVFRRAAGPWTGLSRDRAAAIAVRRGRVGSTSARRDRTSDTMVWDLPDRFRGLRQAPLAGRHLRSGRGGRGRPRAALGKKTMVSDLNKKAMVSGLKWQFGFGWGSVSLFVAFVVISLASSGIVRWIAIVITILAFAFLAVQYKNWNTKGWRQVHGRAMQLYASIAGKETFNAKRANREFSYVQACRELGLALTGKGREVNVEAMILALQREQGSYLASLFEKHAPELLPKADVEQVSNFSNVLRKSSLAHNWLSRT